MNKIDHRIHYIMMTDTETCNTILEEDGRLNMESVLVYDLGWQVIDKRGNVYRQRSLVLRDIFFHEKELMANAYYADKIPQYLKEIAEGKRIVCSLYEARQLYKADMAEYNTLTVCAHNASFDYRALQNTQRWVTKSRWRWFFPYGTEIWDTMAMARSTIAKQKSYISFCEKNGYLTALGKPRLTAEILYRYISGNNDFVESHTGLEDVDIERQILVHCFRQHKTMEKFPFAD